MRGKWWLVATAFVLGIVLGGFSGGMLAGKLPALLGLVGFFVGAGVAGVAGVTTCLLISLCRAASVATSTAKGGDYAAT